MTDHTRTEKIGGDSILFFYSPQVERETVMTAWRLHWRGKWGGPSFLYLSLWIGKGQDRKVRLVWVKDIHVERAWGTVAQAKHHA